ncbi:MAG: ABC transporter substrate-binding protein [Candidatus Velthaea sp.]
MIYAARAALTAAMCASALAACAHNAAFSPEAPHDRMTIVATFEPKSLDPVLEAGSNYQLIADLAFQTLLQLDDRGRWIPDAALAEPKRSNGGISADGKTVIFHLRRGLRWQDGAALTARDVRFTYEANLNPQTNVGSREAFLSIAAMTTPDPYTIVFRLKRPTASFLSDIWTAIVPAHLLQRYPNLNAVPFNGAPVGSGPYRIVEWKRGDRLTLAANPRYWRGRPKIGAITVKFVPAGPTALTQLQTGEANFWWNADANLIAELRRLPSARIALTPIRAWVDVGFNMRDPALADVRVRSAIAHALDMPRIAATAAHGVETTDGVLEAAFGWARDPHLAPPAHDEARANRLLDEAGWVRGADGARHRNGQTLSLLFVYRNNSATYRVAATMIADALARVGIRTEQKTYTFAQLTGLAAQGGIMTSGKFALSLDGLVTNPDPDLSWLIACDQFAPHGFNYYHYCNRSVDAALADAKGTYERARRLRDYAVVQRRLLADLPFAFVYRTREIDVAPAWLKNLKPSTFSPLWNTWEWHD